MEWPAPPSGVVGSPANQEEEEMDISVLNSQTTAGETNAGEADTQGHDDAIKYSRPASSDLKDAFADLTLASMNILQVLGYTRIAGTPLVNRPLHCAV
jgi:hypothetical protein